MAVIGSIRSTTFVKVVDDQSLEIPNNCGKDLTSRTNNLCFHRCCFSSIFGFVFNRFAPCPKPSVCHSYAWIFLIRLFGNYTWSLHKILLGFISSRARNLFRCVTDGCISCSLIAMLIIKKRFVRACIVRKLYLWHFQCCTMLSPHL